MNYHPGIPLPMLLKCRVESLIIYSHVDINSSKDRAFYTVGQKTINYNAGADLFERLVNSNYTLQSQRVYFDRFRFKLPQRLGSDS